MSYSCSSVNSRVVCGVDVLAVGAVVADAEPEKAGVEVVAEVE